MGMIMHDDVPYGEGTSYTQGTGIAINNNVIAVDADNTPTENSEKPVKSKGVYSALESNSAKSASLLKSTVGWTGKNLLKNTASTQTINGVTFTVNADGSITANGSATATINAFWLYQGDFNLEQNKEYILSGCPSGGSLNTYNLSISTWTSGGAYANDTGNGVTINGSDYQYSQYPLLRSGIYIANGQTVSNLTFYPMLRDASITDDTYEPYHESVEEEIEQIYADNGVLGAKNLILNKAISQTINGVTFTVNSDKSITANGTATADSTCFIQGSGWNYNNTVENFLEQGETYILSDGVNSYTGDKNVPNIRMYGYTSAGTVWSYGEITPNTNKEFTVDAIMKSCHISVYIRVPNGQTVSNLVFKPMLRLASDPDDTYVPYAMTNRELTETVDEFTASQAPVNGVVTFSDLNPDYGYKLFVDIPDETSSLPTNLTDLPVCKWTKVQRSTKADGTITLAYTVTNINVNYCLRILK